MQIPTSMSKLTAVACAALLMAACGGASNAQSSPPVVTPPVAQVPPVVPPVVVPPVASAGASARAFALAKAMGRGVNMGNMLESPKADGDWGVVPDKANDYTGFVALAAQAGFTHVRLPVRWSNHAGTDAAAQIDETFAKRVDAMVDAALARNLIVVLNMHHYRQLDGDNQDPGEFAVASDVVDQRFLNMWRQIATRYAARPDSLIFEIYNEPHGRLNSSKWNDLAAQALAVVRQTNPTRAVVLGPTQWNSADLLAQLAVPNDANLIFTFHHYEPFNFTHQGAEWVSPILPTGVTCCSATQTQTIARNFALAQDWSAAKKYPIYLGEFGAYLKADTPSRVAYTRQMREQAESRSMPWSYWELAAGFGLYDPATNTWRAELRGALLP